MIKLRDKKISSGFTPSQTIDRQKKDLVSVTGFTLIEVMLAAAVLVAVLVGILATYISCLELAATARNLTYSVNAIQRQIEDIRDYDFFDIFDDFDNQTFTVNEIPAGSRGIIYVDDSDPDLLEVTISVCWRQRGNRIIGEDLNLNGVLDANEDLNNNGLIDSPAQLITLITVR